MHASRRHINVRADTKLYQLIVVDELVFINYGEKYFGISECNMYGTKTDTTMVISPHDIASLVDIITYARSAHVVSMRLNDILNQSLYYISLDSGGSQYSCSTLLINWPIFVNRIRAELY
jgi:hypothetical protein